MSDFGTGEPLWPGNAFPVDENLRDLHIPGQGDEREYELCQFGRIHENLLFERTAGFDVKRRFESSRIEPNDPNIFIFEFRL